MQAKRNIIKNIHMWKKGVFLKNRIDLSFIRRNVADLNIIKKNLTFGLVDKSTEDPQ
ncbi:hypothetical protein SDC9_125551 [bioreactor metagenome]|uniref:Uncharacterized protein n=1 Tax=bioreactor metagenome TaxID=1076179 RepID=A0A645CNB4_9ZZZZ